jgi:cytochrome c peroxidase
MKKIYFTFFLLAGTALLCGFLTDSPPLNSNSISSKEALGKKLFFDPILSKDNSLSCSSCHKPEFHSAKELMET